MIGSSSAKNRHVKSYVLRILEAESLVLRSGSAPSLKTGEAIRINYRCEHWTWLFSPSDRQRNHPIGIEAAEERL